MCMLSMGFLLAHILVARICYFSLCLSLSLSLSLSLAHRAYPPLLSAVQPLTGSSIARKAHCGFGLTEPAAVTDVLLARLISLGVVLFRDFTLCMLLYTYLPLAYIIVPRIFCFSLSLFCRFSKTFGKRQGVRGRSAVLHFPRQHEQST